VLAAAAGRDAAAENAAQRAPAAPVDPAALLAATLLTEVALFLKHSSALLKNSMPLASRRRQIPPSSQS
jgi:hypothetical protein